MHSSMDNEDKQKTGCDVCQKSSHKINLNLSIEMLQQIPVIRPEYLQIIRVLTIYNLTDSEHNLFLNMSNVLIQLLR